MLEGKQVKGSLFLSFPSGEHGFRRILLYCGMLSLLPLLKIRKTGLFDSLKDLYNRVSSRWSFPCLNMIPTSCLPHMAIKQVQQHRGVK